MYPQSAAVRVYQRALRMNPQTVTLLTRTSTSTPGGSDTYTAYTLYRATFRDLTLDERTMLGMTLADVAKVWTLYHLDLVQASAPDPQLTYAIADQTAAALTGSITSGSQVVTGLSSTSALTPGMVCVGTGIPNATQIQTVDSATQVTLRAAATATNTGASLVFGKLWEAINVSVQIMDAAYLCTTKLAR